MTDQTSTVDRPCACSPHGPCLEHFSGLPPEERRRWVPKYRPQPRPVDQPPAAAGQRGVDP